MSNRLPNAERAFVDIAKLRDYSLNPAHEKGKHKARVFRAALGFTEADAERLRQLVIDAALNSEAALGAPTPYGKRFTVDFQVMGINSSVTIRSAWIVRNDEDFPRLTSCYIVRSKDEDN
ncbi:MAG: DUF6883 domain-containing protein [Blastocatellia bacterium]